jgi:hypothetical protein
MKERAHPHERELRSLMTASLDGDAGAYRRLLEQLTSHLRAYSSIASLESGMVRRRQKIAVYRGLKALAIRIRESKGT